MKFIDGLNSRLPFNTTKRALVLWAMALTAASVAYFTLLPVRDDFASVRKDPRFWMETLAWVPAIFMSAWFAFRKQPIITHPVILKFFPLFAPFLLVMLRMPEHLGNSAAYFSQQDFSNELDFYQGRCGIIILAAGTLVSVIGFSVIRRIVFAPAGEIGGSALLSSGCFASFIMQFVCAHENPLHLFIWHFMPLMLLGLAALCFEKRVHLYAHSARTRLQHQARIREVL